MGGTEIGSLEAHGLSEQMLAQGEILQLRLQCIDLSAAGDRCELRNPSISGRSVPFAPAVHCGGVPTPVGPLPVARC